MPRPQRCRRVCREPSCCCFSPDRESDGSVTLSVDEFEVIRLVDKEKMTHEQCARQMEISRTTVTEIYESARAKIADAIVDGKKLLISGGKYRICGGSSSCCKDPCGFRPKDKEKADCSADRKGVPLMKIAVTYENGSVFAHFGHTKQFKFYEVQEGAVIAEKIVSTMGSGHGALASFLSLNGIDVLLCGGIGGGAKAALEEAGIRLFAGVSGSADEAVKAYLAGTLVFNPNPHCDHHDREHGQGVHTCGPHGCGSH
ncbi:MAG: DUF134 domain-containing protein [Acutalibacteraceae bacterium]